jgi:hypothetical protein
MADEWIGIVQTTMPKYMRGASDLTLRRRLFLSLLKRKGRVSYNHAGDSCKWQVEFAQPEVNSVGDGGVVDFSNPDCYRQLEHDWRGYVSTASMSKKQGAMNKGTNALVNLFQTTQNRITKSMTNNFCGEMYRSGSTSGREQCIHGAETFMTAGTCAVGDKIAMPNGSYGGRDTDLGIEGGVWSATGSSFPNATLANDWPNGNGDSKYDYLSPKLVNWGSTSWGQPSPSNTWLLNCWHVISQTITWLTTTGGEGGKPDICVLGTDLFQGYKNAQRPYQRITVPHKGAMDLGFEDTLNEDGVAIQPDFDCPAQTGYMFNTGTIEVKSLFPELFWYEGPDKDPRSMWSWLWGTGFYGNVTWEPKHAAKLYPYATS